MTERQPSKSRRWLDALLIFGLAVALLSPQAPAQAQLSTIRPAPAPVQLVRALYASHGEAFRGVGKTPLTGGALARPYFHPDMAAALQAKELTFDPLYNGQDAKITGLQIVLDPERRVLRGTAFVRVTFRNFGKPVRLVFLLRQGPKGWRIFEIEGPGWRLSEVLRQAPAAQ